jgi:hypothetical protein
VAVANCTRARARQARIDGAIAAAVVAEAAVV